MKEELTAEVISNMTFQNWELMTVHSQWFAMRILQSKVKRMSVNSDWTIANQESLLTRLKDEVKCLKDMQKKDSEDWCDTDTEVRKQACRVLPKEEVFGDTEAIPAIGDLVELIVAEVDRLKPQCADGIPSVVTTNRGIQFEWHAGGIDLEIEVVSPSWIEMTFSDGELHEDFQHADFRMIKEKLDILRVRLQK